MSDKIYEDIIKYIIKYVDEDSGLFSAELMGHHSIVSHFVFNDVSDKDIDKIKIGNIFKYISGRKDTEEGQREKYNKIEFMEIEPDEIDKIIEIGDNRLKQGFSISACEWYKEAIKLQAKKIKELEKKVRGE